MSRDRVYYSPVLNEIRIFRLTRKYTTVGAALCLGSMYFYIGEV